MKKFDLNIEKILDNWEIYHAIREIIANALDEQTITDTKAIEIFKKDGTWHIRDYGRGLHYKHLTQNENAEKINHGQVIGKFGVGLKDALAVLYKNKIPVQIYSKYGDISLMMCQKEGFKDTQTLHAIINEASQPDMIGTEFVLKVSDDDIQKAKDLFLVFSNALPLEATGYGEIYEKSEKENACIYVHGVKVAEEENYFFNYNITKTNKQLEKSLNRERSAVGRTAYSDIIKKILLMAKSAKVAKLLVSQLKLIPAGTSCDEVNYIDIQEHCIKVCNMKSDDVVFVPMSESITMSPDKREIIEEAGKNIVLVPDAVFSKIKSAKDYLGKSICTFETVQQDYNDAFEYAFVDLRTLSKEEKAILIKGTDFVFSIYGSPKYKDRIRISETINPWITGDTLGCYDPDLDSIIIKRSQLVTFSDFCEVLFHELVHATSGYPDNSRAFENELGSIIRRLVFLLASTQEDVTSPVSKSGIKGFLKRIL